MDISDVVWSETFADEELDGEFDYERRDEPPWFGFVPRVLVVHLVRPFTARFALWRDGRIVEKGRLNVDRRRAAGMVRPLLLVAERFADLCRGRNLFGAYLALAAPGSDAASAAVTAAFVREADWCGMFVLEPAAAAGKRGNDAVVLMAARVAAALEGGKLRPAQPVARSWAAPGGAP